MNTDPYRAEKSTNRIKRSVEKRSWERKESERKWKKDHPDREPGTSLKTWKSYSKQRFGTEKYRSNYINIDWDADEH